MVNNVEYYLDSPLKNILHLDGANLKLFLVNPLMKSIDTIWNITYMYYNIS